MATLDKPVNIIVSKQVEILAILKNWRSLHLQFGIFVSRKSVDGVEEVDIEEMEVWARRTQSV